MENLGVMIRRLREKQSSPLRHVAAYLDFDQAILSKIERGQRYATRDQVLKLAKYYNVKEDDLLIAWLADKIFCEVENEKMGLKALHATKIRIVNKTRLKK